MPRSDPADKRARLGDVRIRRRHFLSGAAAALVAARSPVFAQAPIRFGLTPVFLTNDLELLSKLKGYLEGATGYPVQLVTRRTYQEITALLVSGQLEAAWICGYPFVQYRDRLELVAVPVWRARPLYQSYLIVPRGRPADGIESLEGDVHAFSDPDSNSGYLVTRAMLAERGTDPTRFFRHTIFTYGHRNVVRAVASGLARSGSVDGYVLEVMGETEPDLAGAVDVVRRSEWLGFPPVACPKSMAGSESVERIGAALTTMADDALGREVLATLRLDGFSREPASLFDEIAAKVDLVRRFG